MNKLIRKIEKGLQTDVGQRFLQYAYSFGAAIVIFGAMVKVLHWWGIWGNIIFGTGMVIECIVFILYGLDRPEATPAAPYPALHREESAPLSTLATDLANLLTPVAEGTAQYAQATERIAKLSESLQESCRQIIENSQQMGRHSLEVDALNRETARMTRQIQELNQIYGRLIQAMSSGNGTEKQEEG